MKIIKRSTLIVIPERDFKRLIALSLAPRNGGQLDRIRVQVRKIDGRSMVIKPCVSPLVRLCRHVVWAYWDLELQGLK